MLKNIYMTLEEGKNLCLILGGRNKFGHVNMTKEEQKKAHMNHTDCFRDMSGNAYVTLHGGEEVIDGKIYGFLNFRGDSYTYPETVYKNLIEEGFIKDGETLHIICCFGAGVRECSERRVKNGFAEAKPIIYENDTHTTCYSSACVLSNGTVRYTIGTMNNIIEKIAYKITASK